jgi:hypothetical protein
MTTEKEMLLGYSIEMMIPIPLNNDAQNPIEFGIAKTTKL